MQECLLVIFPKKTGISYTDIRTDMTELVAAFRNFANARKKSIT
jgi:hypothetical protein